MITNAGENRGEHIYEHIYDQVKSWYTKKGISTEQFFRTNSTETGLEEMMNDFAHRHLGALDSIKLARHLFECERFTRVKDL